MRDRAKALIPKARSLTRAFELQIEVREPGWLSHCFAICRSTTKSPTSVGAPMADKTMSPALVSPKHHTPKHSPHWDADPEGDSGVEGLGLRLHEFLGGPGGREQLMCFRAGGSGLPSSLQHQRLLGNVCRIGWNIMEIVSAALWPGNSRSMRRISSAPIFLPSFESKAFG